MNRYISYVDIPTIPTEIMPSATEVLELPDLLYGENFERMRHPHSKATFFRKFVTPQLKEWLLANFNFKMCACFVIFKGDSMPVHRDLRSRTYNYIIDPGGENISTIIWNDERKKFDLSEWKDSKSNMLSSENYIEPLESMVVESNKWWLLHSDMLHSIRGKIERPRIMLSVIKEDFINLPSDHILSEEIKSWFNSNAW